MNRATVMTDDEYEEMTIKLALDGDHAAGREALRLCREGLDRGVLSVRLSGYLAERLLQVEKAIAESEQLRTVKGPSSVRSSRDTAIADALRINRPAKKPTDKLPEWQVPYAAFGTLLLNSGMRREKVYAAMDAARFQNEGKNLDRRDAQRIVTNYKPLSEIGRALQLDKSDGIGDELLRDMVGPLREILRSYLPQESDR
jgi:hypothetical protein